MPTVPSSNLVAINNLAGNLPASPAQIGLVLGPTVSGTANGILLDDSINSVLTNFGGGPGSEVAGTALNEPNHGTIYQIKTATSVAGVAGSVTKTSGATVGAESNAFGAVRVDGVDDNGDVTFLSKVAGAELSITAGGATSTTVNGLNVALVVTAGTTGTQLAALITGVPAALALWGAVAHGTGASVCGQSLATYSETSGRIVFQALTSSMQYRLLVPAASQPRLVVLTGGTIVDIQLQTNAATQYISSAIDVQSDLVALATANPGKFRTTLAGSGLGLVGPKAITSLSFGSTGTMAVSGAPNDGYDVTVEILTGGALGTATFRISLGKAAGIPIYSEGIYQIPSGGIITIPDTGLTLTFANTFDALDRFAFLCTAPLSTLADVSTALTYFITRPEQAALIAIAGEIPVLSLPAWIAALNTLGNQLEAAKKYCRILIEYAGPSSGQTNAAWASLVAGTIAAYSSARLSLNGGNENTVSALPLPQAGRFETVNCMRSIFARALALPSGVDVGDQTRSGAMTSVISGAQTDVATALAGARSSYLYLLTGIPGVQAEALLFDSPTGDFTYLTYGRVLDEAMFYGYLGQTKYLNTAQQRNPDGTIEVGAAIAIQKDLRAILLDKIVTPGNASDVQVVVDRTNTDNRLKITYYVQIKFYVKRIDGRAGITRTVSATQTL